MKHLKTFEGYNSLSKSEMVDMLVENKGIERSDIQQLNESVIDWLVKMFNKLDKGGRAEDFIKGMPTKISTLRRAKGGLVSEPTVDEMDAIMKQADEDSYVGKLGVRGGKLAYIGSEEPVISNQKSTFG